MRTLDIGLDADGVIYPFVDVFRDWLAVSEGRNRATMLPASQDRFFLDWNLTAQDFDDKLTEAIDHGAMYADGAPLAGSMETIRALTDAGHRLHLITDRGRHGSPGRAEAATRAYFQQRDINFATMTFTQHKGAAALGLNLATHLDDLSANCDQLTQAGVPSMCFDAPYNQRYRGPRVRSWAEFLDHVTELAHTPARPR